MVVNRPKCSIEGCSNIAKISGKNKKGKLSFHKKCNKHHQGSANWKNREKEKLFPENSECTLCKWEGPCDRHRLKMGKDGGKYILGNVVILCPNCHRLLHLGLLTLK